MTPHFDEQMTISWIQIFDDINFMKSDAGYSKPIEFFQDGICSSFFIVNHSFMYLCKKCIFEKTVMSTFYNGDFFFMLYFNITEVLSF
jgi:hypothetical protein